MKVLGIIPARKGSKRVPNKNIRPFAGTTLTTLAIQQALEAKYLDTILVSSDSQEILQLTKQFQNIIPIRRPNNLATDKSPAIDYMKHALNLLEMEYNKTFDIIVIIQPTSPLRFGKNIDKTIELFMDNPDADSVVSIVPIEHMTHPQKLKIMRGNKLLPFITDEGDLPATHELPNVFVRNCAVYLFKTSNIKNNILLGSNSLGYKMPSETAVDINTMIEFEFAEYIYKKYYYETK